VLPPPRGQKGQVHQGDADPGGVVGLPEQLEGLQTGGERFFLSPCPPVGVRQPEEIEREVQSLLQSPPDRHVFLEAGDDRIPPAGPGIPHHQHRQDLGHAPLVTRLPEEREALLEHVRCMLQVIAGHDEGQVVDGLGDPLGIAQLPLDGDGLRVEDARGLPVLLPPGDPSRSDQRLRPGRRSALPGRHRQDLREPPSPLGQVPALLPEAPQRTGRFLGSDRVAALDGPPQGGPDVGMFDLTAVEPLELIRRGEVGLGLHGQGQEVIGVAAEHRIEVGPGRQLFQRELPDGLQHGEARGAVGQLGRPDQ
jgi:hypothetical protein